MKLRNIFLATLAVCTMGSCSKENDDIPSGPVQPVDAVVSFAATADIKVKAAATDEGFEKERIVHTLTAYIFKDAETDAGKVLAGTQTVTAEGDNSIDKIEHIVVKVSPVDEDGSATADKFIAVLVANANTEALSGVNTLADLKAKTLTKNAWEYTPGTDFIPMRSEEIGITGLKPYAVGGDKYENWVGTKVEYLIENVDKPAVDNVIMLKRLTARVQVEDISVQFDDTYPGASFTLDRLSLVNVHPTSTLEGGNGTYVKGGQSSGYEIDRGWIYPGNRDQVTEGLGKAYEGVDPSKVTWQDGESRDFCRYIFANPAKGDKADIYETALLITGKFKRQTNSTPEVRNFRVLLKDDAATDKNPQVLMNNIYKLFVTITGEGSGNEDNIELNAHVSFKIEVAPWNVINQTEDDTN